jgi:hypothetical protein
MSERMPTIDRPEAAWFRAALRECITYGDHGTFIEEVDRGAVCFDCRGEL